MAQVRGIGGIFFKSKDPKALYAWYQQHLGITAKPGAGAMFPWKRADDSGQEEMTVWSVFPAGSDYFRDPERKFMLNYIVNDSRRGSRRTARSGRRGRSARGEV